MIRDQDGMIPVGETKLFLEKLGRLPLCHVSLKESYLTAKQIQ